LSLVFFVFTESFSIDNLREMWRIQNAALSSLQWLKEISSPQPFHNRIRRFEMHALWSIWFGSLWSL